MRTASRFASAVPWPADCLVICGIKAPTVRRRLEAVTLRMLARYALSAKQNKNFHKLNPICVTK